MQQKHYFFISYKTKGLYKSILPKPINVPEPYKEISEIDYRRFCLQLTRSPEYEMGFDNFGNPKAVHFSENITVSELKEKVANFHIDTLNDVTRNHIIEQDDIKLIITSTVFQLFESCYILGRNHFSTDLIIKDNDNKVVSVDFDTMERILIKRNLFLRKLNASKVSISTTLQSCNDKNKLLDTYKHIKYKDFLK